MSTIQLAELSGINKNSIYVLLEKTDINPTINTLERISNALEISVQRLLDLPKKIEEFIDDASN
jgi:transcriptional regulator with XRE-family HTH domain